MDESLTVKQASLWASERLGKVVTSSNISYLINYGRIKKIEKDNKIFVALGELESYYARLQQQREQQWAQGRKDEVCWKLSFQECKEAETTKHVHRLHPYKGKFIPQLAEYFLDDHTDEFKTESVFKEGDIVLDPFCGSGTTLVQAGELGLHAVGIDISFFNSMIGNLKIMEFDFDDLLRHIALTLKKLEENKASQHVRVFDRELSKQLSAFNNTFFLKNSVKQKIHAGDIDDRPYGLASEKKFLSKYNNLCLHHKIKIENDSEKRFLDKWFLYPVKQEILLIKKYIDTIEESSTRRLLQLVLSRTMRSCRATRHADLATLRGTISAPYYCRKHGKICKPLFSVLGWWKRYTQDTLERLKIYTSLRKPSFQCCLIGDARELNIDTALSNAHSKLHEKFLDKKFRGIFSSPPYVGLIDYHEQHAYAYDIFNFPRRDDKEIGAKGQGQGWQARKDYAQAIAKTLLHTQNFMIDDCDIFLVANDKYNLYPTIAEEAGLKIHKTYIRPVLNRSEGDKGAYSETIFHMRRTL